MLTREEEARIRETVRKSLENILHEPRPGEAAPDPGAGERLSDAKRIIAEETERYYLAQGLVKHVSRSGQVFWVTPAEHERLTRSRQRRHRRSVFDRVKPRVALVWTVTILVTVLLVVYLLNTEMLVNFMAR